MNILSEKVPKIFLTKKLTFSGNLGITFIYYFSDAVSNEIVSDLFNGGFYKRCYMNLNLQSTQLINFIEYSVAL